MVNARKKFAGGKGGISAHGVHELSLHADNEYTVYRTQEAWAENFAKKMKRGTFNRSLALKGIANNYVPEVARDYRKRHGVETAREYDIPDRMSAVDKRKVAAHLLPGIIEDAKYRLAKMKPTKAKRKK